MPIGLAGSYPFPPSLPVKAGHTGWQKIEMKKIILQWMERKYSLSTQ